MTKYHVEVCVASARGLRRTFFRSQWFAVAWIDPKLKYCTGIDARGTTTPLWNTKFSATVDDADATLHVQVFSRDSLFLRERLEGAVRIHLREFLAKLNEGGSPAGVFPDAAEGLIVESGSFQLRKNHSQKPRGFVEISVRISDRPNVESWAPREGTSGVFNGMPMSISGGNEIVSSDDHVNPSHPYSFPPPSSQGKLGSYSHSHFVPNNAPNFPPNDSPHLPPDNARPTAPPPPPPPTNTGFLLPFFEPSSGQRNATYLSMPPSTSAAGRGRQGTGFGAAAAAGSAMAAGAFLFGDDFLNAMDYTSSLDDGSVAISGNPLL